MFSVNIVVCDYISCVFQLLSRKMVYSLARDIHAACGMVRQKRKEENRKKEREGRREKVKVKSKWKVMESFRAVGLY